MHHKLPPHEIERIAREARMAGSGIQLVGRPDPQIQIAGKDAVDSFNICWTTDGRFLLEVSTNKAGEVHSFFTGVIGPFIAVMPTTEAKVTGESEP